MATIDEIKRKALELSEKTDSNSITPKEVGGIMYDLASHSENVLRNGGTLGIRKVYESVAAMEADSTNPKDFWGDPIKKGNLVVIYDGTSTGVDNNKIYAFMKPGWQIATHLDAGYATKASLDAAIENILLQFGSKVGTDGGTLVLDSESYKDIMWNGTSVISSNVMYNAVVIELYEGATYNWDNQVSAIAFPNYPAVGMTGGVSVSKGFKAVKGQSFLLITLENGKSTTVTYSMSGVFAEIDKVNTALNTLDNRATKIDNSVKGLYQVSTKNGMYIKADGSEVELEATYITDIIPIDTIVYPFVLWTNALARSVEYYDNSGRAIGYYIGSSTASVTINKKGELPNMPENAVYARFSNLTNNVIYAGNGVASQLFKLIQGSSEKTKRNLYINKPLSQGGTRVDGQVFLNDFIITSNASAAMAEIPIVGGETYSIYRNYDTPYWRDNFLAIVFRDESGNVLSHSNEFPFDGSDYQNAGYPPYTRTSYKGLDNCVVIKSPINATRMTFNIKVSNYDFRNDGDVVVVKGFGFEEDDDILSLVELNGLSLKDNLAREMIEKSKKPYINKIWSCIGDSITEKNYWAVTQYHDLVANDLGLSVKNYGVSGTGYKQDFDYGNKGKGFPNRALLINPNTDVCTIFGSVNDKGWYNTNLGESTDVYAEGVSDSLAACINLTIDNVLSVCPDVKLGLITPIPSGEFPTTIKDNGMSKYANLIIEIGKLRGIPVLDLYHSSSLRPWDNNFCDKYFKSDDPRQTSVTNNVHPNSLGHKWFAPLVREFVKGLL